MVVPIFSINFPFLWDTHQIYDILILWQVINYISFMKDLELPLVYNV